VANHEASEPVNQPLDAHSFDITIFPDNAARTKNQQSLTLPSLAAAILATRAKRKDKLPLLKLASFGDDASAKNCLRTNANMGAISGVEVEHDAGDVSYRVAVRILRKAGVRALIYTTPSHSPLKERWRALLPTSQPFAKEDRAALVAEVNGLFGGKLARESFAMSQAFYFGSVEGQEPAIVTVLDGLCFDLLPDAKAIYPAASNVVQLLKPSGGTSLNLEDLDAMLEEYQRTGEGWHNCMLTCTASLVARQWDDVAIRGKLGPYCWNGPSDPDLLELLDSARAKFGRKPPPAALAAILRPSDQTAPEAIAEELETAEAPSMPAFDAPLADKVNWLLVTHGYEVAEDRVVRLFSTSNTCRIKPNAFREQYASWFTVQIGPRGGSNKVRATDGWQVAEHRLAIEGVRMAPDCAFPIYVEDGAVYKNTYRRPRHEAPAAHAAGDAAPFLSFLERLIPDDKSREYKLDWLAYKLRHPEVPGCAILHVADNDGDDTGAHEGRFGTGRGLLFSIARRLFGEAYCSEQDFRILDGSSGQSVYTSWLHENILVTCDESPSSPTYYRAGERHVAYELLKRIVDPAITTRTFTAKYRGAFTGKCHCSIWIATNHIDALTIPADDRRISVIRNGRAPTETEVAEIVAWRDAPGSLATLQAFLMARDVSGFNAYKPLKSAAKDEMVEATLSDVEQTMRDILGDDERGMVFTRDDLFNAVRMAHAQEGAFAGHFQMAWRKWVSKALVVRPGETQSTQRRVRVGSTQKKLFCARRMTKTVLHFTEEEAHDEAMRWRPGISGIVVA
jgi:hypothetical protein